MNKRQTVLICIIVVTVSPFVINAFFDLKPKEIHREILDENVLIVYPLMTEIAYQPDSFYSFYKGECDECRTHSISVQKGNRYVLGLNSYDLFYKNYNSMTDVKIHTDLIDLGKYHTVILLHNEYATQYVYDQITNHPNVIYLYPNTLYGLVTLDAEKNTITLERGHGYPDNIIRNGFDWEHENTYEEENCTDWEFRNVSNGIQLNCYPENIIKNDTILQKYIHDYISSKALSKSLTK